MRSAPWIVIAICLGVLGWSIDRQQSTPPDTDLDHSETQRLRELAEKQDQRIRELQASLANSRRQPEPGPAKTSVPIPSPSPGADEFETKPPVEAEWPFLSESSLPESFRGKFSASDVVIDIGNGQIGRLVTPGFDPTESPESLAAAKDVAYLYSERVDDWESFLAIKAEDQASLQVFDTPEDASRFATDSKASDYQLFESSRGWVIVPKRSELKQEFRWGEYQTKIDTAMSEGGIPGVMFFRYELDWFEG